MSEHEFREAARSVIADACDGDHTDLVLQAAAGKRDDLIGPDTGPGSVVREADGQID